MRKLIRKFLNRFGYDIVKLPPVIKPEERADLKKLFSRIYHDNLWGGEKGEFYSGPGSDDQVGVEYAKAIKYYIAKHNINTVVDIGCGDFRIAKQFVSDNIHYTGIDVVPDLIETNQKLYANENIEFKCIDATKEDLPDADLCLIRQVLQHLSNSHIEEILAKCRKYKHLVVSEHILVGENVIPNLDMDADWNIRIEKNSCIRLDQPPFNAGTELLVEVDPHHFNQPNSRIRTERVFL
jgi:hypothetical protein